MEKIAVIMIGIQGSGKSEFCRRYLSDGYVRINLDTLKTRARERKSFETCLCEGTSFVVDNTNPTKTDRARYIPAAKAAGYRIIGCFMQSDLDACITRNEKRAGKERIPVIAILGTFNRLEMPSLEEGFDELYYIANDGVEMTPMDWRADT